MNLHELRQEYLNKPFLESEAGDDPMALFKEWFQAAKEAEQPEPNAFSLATFGPDGFPENRIVLLKEVEPEGFVFYTNYNSQKARDMAHCSLVSMNFWWEALHRQIRVKGEVEKVDEAQSEAYFAGRPKGSQVGAHASQQSKELGDRKEMEEAFQKLDAQYKEQEKVPKPDDWGGYRIKPVYFEYWQGQASRMHDRIAFEKQEAAWLRKRLWP